MPKKKAMRGRRGECNLKDSDKQEEDFAANESEELCKENEINDSNQDDIRWVEVDERQPDDMTNLSESKEISDMIDSDNLSTSDEQRKPVEQEEVTDSQHLKVSDTEELTTTEDPATETAADKHHIESSITKELIVTGVESCTDDQAETGGKLELTDDGIMETVDEVGEVEEMNMELFRIDREETAEEREVEEVQYIDEEAEEDQVYDVNEVNSKMRTETSSDKTDEKAQQSSQQDGKVYQRKPSGQAEELYDNKFEEISEGSMGQVEQEEILNESLSDVETIKEPLASETKSCALPSNKTEEGKGKASTPYKEAESLEEVFFATENDDARIMAEDKDNDDISDESLSHHADDNLSLEEISDDDLEPSKKKRRTSRPSLEKSGNSSKPVDISIKSNEMETTINSELNREEKTDPDTSCSGLKRTLGEERESDESRVVKKHKTCDDDRGPSTDEPLFFTGICSNTNKPNVSKLDTSQNKNQEQASRNLQQIAKQEVVMRKERSLSSRDNVEPRRSYVSSSSQTEPRQLKGKIVQCSITSLQPQRVKQPSMDVATTSKLYENFKYLLPSSIPENIFVDITSLQSAEEREIYTFSMGPVTLSDMDSPEFREVTLRGAQKFSLSFGHHCQGIFKATLGKEDDVVSLMRQLKRLELGNRYMVMSIQQKSGDRVEPYVLKATITFMYEQDIQMESQGLVSDGKLRARLGLKNVPTGVSKDFIHLLFPEALTVSTDRMNTENKVVVLGFSNGKMVEEILSCYDLLIINGSQISMIEMDSTAQLEDTDSEVPSFVVVEEAISDEGEETEATKSSTLISVEADVQVTQMGKGSGEETTAVNSTIDVLNQEKQETSSSDKSEKGDSAPLGEVDNLQGSKSLSIRVSEQLNTDTVVAVDNEKENIEDMEESATEIVQNILDNVIDAVVGKTNEEVKLSREKESDKNESILINTEVTSGHPVSEVKENEKELYEESIDQQTLNLGVGDSSPVQILNVEEGITTETPDVIASQPALEAQMLKQAKNEHLEDVSDDEMPTQTRDSEHLDDVVIVREDPFKKVIASIELNVDVSPGLNTNRDTCERDTGDLIKVEKKSPEKDIVAGKKSDTKLIITDGSLQVSMEVENVEEEMEYESVLYPRFRSQYSNRQERSKFSSEKTIPLAVNEEQRNKSYQRDTFRPSYKYRSGSSREDSPRYHAPSRVESTSYRKDYYHHERRRSPCLPEKDAGRYGEATSYQHSRPVHKPDYYQGLEGKYSHGGHWNKSYDNKWQSSYHGESSRTDFTSRAPPESSSRQKEWQVRSSTRQSTWQNDTHSSNQPRDQYIYSDSRASYYPSHKYSSRRSRSRSRSLSDMSASSHSRSPAKYKPVYHKKSPVRRPTHTSRSPISVSSHSRSLSPVSKSPTPNASPSSKKHLVETVKHFLHLARGLRENKKIQFSQSKSPRPRVSKCSVSPQPMRSHSPARLSGHPERYVYSKPHKRNSPPPRVIRSRSPQPSYSRHSRSPVKIRSHRNWRNQSISPVSSVGSRDSRNHSYPSRRKTSRDVEKSKRYESKRLHRRDNHSTSRPDPVVWPTSSQWSEQRHAEQHRYPTDQSWYQERQGLTAAPVFNPAYPPPSFPAGSHYPPSQQHLSAYSTPTAPVPLYSYNQPPPMYGYSNLQPSDTTISQTVAPPQLAEAYQQAITLLQSAMTSQPADQSYPHPQSSSLQQPNTSAQSSSDKRPSSSSHSQNKKSWSLGSNAMVFQRILGKDGKKQSK